MTEVTEVYLGGTDADIMWLLFGAVLVFYMQTGFAMLCVGCVQAKNQKNILIKNVFDAAVGALCWWATGAGIALGKDDYVEDGSNGFVGGSGYFLKNTEGYAKAMWLFQWAFAATAATIVAGAVAERITFTAYLIYSTILTAFVYPVVVHAGWTSGVFSAWREEKLSQGCGLTDFAGSGVVHFTGGIAALVGIIILGPRKGRFGANGVVNPFPQSSMIFQTLGTLILWFGWYGFNGVSTLYIVGYGGVAAHVMCTTTIAAASGCLTTCLLGRIFDGVIDPANANNGLLAGLVGITASCSVVAPEGAFLIGIAAGFIFFFGCRVLLACRLDDVVGAVPVHCFCGIWGVIASGLFATEKYYSAAYYGARASKCAGILYGGSGATLGVGITFLLFVTAWVGGTMLVLFTLMRMFGILRVSKEVEDAGMDSSEHGGMDDYAPKEAGGARFGGGKSAKF
jgi:Amt family ammonium transporter